MKVNRLILAIARRGVIVLASTWLIAVLILQVAGWHAFWRESKSFWEWWGHIQDMYDPYNFGNAMAMLLVLSPLGLSAWMVSKIDEKMALGRDTNNATGERVVE